MPVSSLGYKLEVQRGPNWLLVRIKCPHAEKLELPLAEELRALMQKHFIYRVVLELDELPRLSSSLLEEISRVQQWVKEHDGMLRLCGLSPYNLQVLRAQKSEMQHASFRNRQEAILGQYYPFQPR